LRGSSPDLFSQAALVNADDLVRAATGFGDLIPTTDRHPPGPSGTARIIENGGHRLIIGAESETPAVLVISDALLPLWSARIDGIEVPLLRFNYSFRGVYLDRGEHTVELVCSPWSRQRFDDSRNRLRAP
jgi:hypothetical protein